MLDRTRGQSDLSVIGFTKEKNEGISMKKFATLLFALLAIGCSDAPEPDLEGLKAMEGEWQAGFDTRNAAAIAAVYAEKARCCRQTAQG